MTGPAAGGGAGDVVRCRGKHCFAAIRWFLTVDGGWMPVDPDPRPDGNVVWAETPQGWRLRVLAKDEQVPDTVRRFMAHWATCVDSVVFKVVQKVFPDAEVIDNGVPAVPLHAAPARRPAREGLFDDAG